MLFHAGTRPGPYEILAAIGAEMGEVYRARDTKLGRDVALKLLPEAFATERVPVVEGVRRGLGGAVPAAQLATSGTGALVYIPGPTGTRTAERTLALADRAGVVTRLAVPAGPCVHVRASRDQSVRPAASEIRVVLNWFEELKQRVPPSP